MKLGPDCWHLATATFNTPSRYLPTSDVFRYRNEFNLMGHWQPRRTSFTGVLRPQGRRPFKLGTLSYKNGATTVGSALDGITLDIALGFANVPELNFVYHAGLSINNTPNTADPIASADFVKVRGRQLLRLI